MSDTEAQRQWSNFTPATVASVLAITLDAATHPYDLNALALGSPIPLPGGPAADGTAGEYVFVEMIADVDFFYAFGPVTGTIDKTAALAAGGTVGGAFTANACELVPAKTTKRVRISRTNHRWLMLQGSGAGIVRVRASSQPSARWAK